MSEVLVKVSPNHEESHRNPPHHRFSDGIKLSMHEFASGYVELHTTPHARFDVKLYVDGCWHVKVTDWELDLGMAGWECYDTLSEARRAASRAFTFFKRREAMSAEPVERNKFGSPAEWA